MDIETYRSLVNDKELYEAFKVIKSKFNNQGIYKEHEAYDVINALLWENYYHDRLAAGLYFYKVTGEYTITKTLPHTSYEFARTPEEAVEKTNEYYRTTRSDCSYIYTQFSAEEAAIGEQYLKDMYFSDDDDED